MKMTKKKIFALSLIVCAIAIVSMGTLAWFTAQDSVTNKFMVGDSTVDPDEVFGIDVWEEVDTDRDPSTALVEIGKGDTTENSATYELILPGEVMGKKPYLTNTGVHPQFVRAIVTVTEADILKDAMIPKYSTVSEWFKAEKFLPGTDPKWTLEYKFYNNDDTFTFVYYYNEVLEAGATTTKLFDAVVIPTELTLDQAILMDNFDITVVGEAIQAEHLADPAVPGAMITTAKAAFETYWDEEGYVAGIEQNPTVTVSYPMTGNYGTIKEDLVVYDPANYTDPETAGNLVINDLTATIKTGASLVVIPDEERNSSILIFGADFTIENGGAIATTTPGAHTVYVVEPITINGVEMTSANWAEMVANYFVGYDTFNVIKMY